MAASAAQSNSAPPSEAAKRLNTRAALFRATGFDDTTSPLTALIAAAAAAAAAARALVLPNVEVFSEFPLLGF